MQNNNRTPALLAIVLLTACTRAQAAQWQLAAGKTLEDGAAFELARDSGHWEAALGYVTEQRVSVDYVTTTCAYPDAPPQFCSTSVRHARDPVDAYGYLSLQRRFEFRRGARFRPLLGAGLVGTTDTNEYVSTSLNFSLSLGLRLGESLSVEWRHFSNAGAHGPNLGQDSVLLRWQLR